LAVLAAATAGFAPAAAAEPIVPTSDDEVIETLPGGAGRVVERRWRQQLSVRPDDAALATALARRLLDRSRAEGDPRHAGQALAVLAAWQDDAAAPADVVLLRATLLQHLHRFDDAATALERLLQREGRLPQAWLTLATVRRVQGRYGLSDAACREVAAAGAALHGAACSAENTALRGRFDEARAALQRLLGEAAADPVTRAWLLATLAELEERAGRTQAADAAWRAARAADLAARRGAGAGDPYLALGLADALLAQGRAGEVPAVLSGQPRSDAVLLRLAMAGARTDEIALLRERMAVAAQRPGPALHAREQAMFALHVERDPARALQLARESTRLQREPLDLLVYAQAARAAQDPGALREVRALSEEIGLRDRRIDALL
jgi:tetratricopeptide (TPR) repeat protein